jgi:hypothetical protein
LTICYKKTNNNPSSFTVSEKTVLLTLLVLVLSCAHLLSLFKTSKKMNINPGAVVSDDHAHESLRADGLKASVPPRAILQKEVVANNGSEGNFWAVVDGFVVDATEFVDIHPGGRKKLLSADNPHIGSTGAAFGFSFSIGRNAHFPQTGKSFREGVERYLAGPSVGGYLAPSDVQFPPHGKIIILGRLEG